MAFLVALPFAGAPLAAFAPPLAFLAAFGFVSGAGLTASPSPSMRSQILLTPALAVLKLFTGSTPGRLFQIATTRSAGQVPASRASSLWLAKDSRGLVVEAAASSAVANTLTLLSASIVNVVIIFLLCSALFAVNTWITPVAPTSKRILLQIDKRGDGKAIGGMR